MTNVELSQALQALADEFGGTFDLVSDEDEDDYYAQMDVGDIWVQFHRYTVTRWIAGARIGGDGVSEDSGLVAAHYVDTILVWLRAKLLELTREEREREFDALVDEMLSAYDVFAAELHGPTEFGLSERMSRLVDAKRLELRKLAFGGN